MSATTNRNKTVVVPKDTVVKTEATPFLLHDGDFLRLTKLHSFTSIWAHSFLAGTGIYIITIVARFIDHRYFNGPSEVTSYEWVTLEILGVLVVIFEGLHLLLPSEKKRTIKKIREHFKTAASS